MKSRGFDARYGSASSEPHGIKEDGIILREAIPYPPFSGLLIRGTGGYAGYEVKLFYVDGLWCGPCSAGTTIGYAENLAFKYPGIPNHVHIEVRRGGALI